MRSGNTYIPNEIFSWDLNPNEKLLCIWLLTHAESYKVNAHRVSQQLSITWRYAKKLLEELPEKVKKLLGESTQNTEAIQNIFHILSDPQRQEKLCSKDDMSKSIVDSASGHNDVCSGAQYDSAPEHNEKYYKNKQENDYREKSAPSWENPKGKLSFEQKKAQLEKVLRERSAEILEWPEIQTYPPLLEEYKERFLWYLEEHPNKTYKNWYAAFKSCVKSDWGNLRKNYISRSGEVSVQNRESQSAISSFKGLSFRTQDVILHEQAKKRFIEQIEKEKNETHRYGF